MKCFDIICQIRYYYSEYLSDNICPYQYRPDIAMIGQYRPMIYQPQYLLCIPVVNFSRLSPAVTSPSGSMPICPSSESGVWSWWSVMLELARSWSRWMLSCVPYIKETDYLESYLVSPIQLYVSFLFIIDYDKYGAQPIINVFSKYRCLSVSYRCAMCVVMTVFAS